MTNQPTWRRSSRCETSACVEIAYTTGGTVHIRDSKHPAGPVLAFTGPEWQAFVAGVKNDEFDLHTDNDASNRGNLPS